MDVESTEITGLCVSLSRDGKVVRSRSDRIVAFIEQVAAANVAWVNFAVADIKLDSERIAQQYGFSSQLASVLTAEGQSAYEDFDIELGLKLPALKIKDLEVTVSPVLFFIRKGLVLTIHGKEVTRFVRFDRYAETVLRKMPASSTIIDRVTILATRLIEEHNERNFDAARSIEERADEISKHLADLNMPREKLGVRVYQLKHALITYLDALWATLDVTNSLRYGDADVLTDNAKLLQRLGLLSDDVNRQIALGEHMSEVLASGLEVLQSIYNNQLQMLNNRMSMAMAWMAILGTALLVPNTIATILAAGAVPLSIGDIWWYVPLIFGSTVISTYFAYYFVRKKGWIPTRLALV